MTDTTTASGPDLQASLDAFLALVHKTAEEKGYCGQYEDVLRSAAAANPDKLEYVEAPTTKTVSWESTYRITFAPGVDPEDEFKSWCEANGTKHLAHIERYTNGEDAHHNRYGDPTPATLEHREARDVLLRQWYESLLAAGDGRIKVSGSYIEDFADAAIRGEKVGRGRLVCKTTQATTTES